MDLPSKDTNSICCIFLYFEDLNVDAIQTKLNKNTHQRPTTQILKKNQNKDI